MKKKREIKKSIPDFVLRVNAVDAKFDPVIVDQIVDPRVECKNCLGFASNPFRGKCKAGEIQFADQKINCSSFYKTQQNTEVVWV